MANVKISTLPGAAALTGTEEVPAVQSAATVKTTAQAIADIAITAVVAGAPASLNTLDELAAAINDDPAFSTTVNTALGLKADLASPTFTGSPAAPTQTAGDNTTKLATTAFVKTAVEAAITGLSWKQAVRVATTGPGTISTDFENGDTIDGVVLATGDRILIKDQAAPTENGIYIVAASGAPARSLDADSGTELVNASVYVSEGTANEETQWTCATNAPITVGVTNITFSQLVSGGGTTVAIDPIWDTKGDIAVATGTDAASKVPVGTNGQVLTADSAEATGVKWATPASGSVATDSIFDAKGDLPVGTGANTATKLSVGTNGQVLTADSAEATGVKWATPSGGSSIGKHAVYVDVQAMLPYLTAPASALIQSAGAAGQPDFWYAELDETTARYLVFRLTMPKSWNAGTISYKVVWQHATATTNFGVAFGLEAVAHQDNTSLATNFGTQVVVTDTGSATNNLVFITDESSAVTVGNSPAKGNLVNFRLGRLPANGSDTMAAKVRLIGVVLFITTDAGTDA